VSTEVSTAVQDENPLGILISFENKLCPSANGRIYYTHGVVMVSHLSFCSTWCQPDACLMFTWIGVIHSNPIQILVGFSGPLNVIQDDLQLGWLKKLRQIGFYDHRRRAPRWMEVLPVRWASILPCLAEQLQSDRFGWMDGWRAQFAAEAIAIHSAHELLSEGTSTTRTGDD